MDVAVDDAGDQRAAGGIDPLAGEARKLALGRHALDLAALFQHRLPVVNFLTVEQTPADIQGSHTTLPN